jgi:ABC-type transporter Mla maintaining outer membrane lipid asymmetry ATPase subunit MlaF
MNPPAMHVRLRAEHGKRCVLQGLEFDLYAEKSPGTIGASGAGKTTLAISLG